MKYQDDILVMPTVRIKPCDLEKLQSGDRFTNSVQENDVIIYDGGLDFRYYPTSQEAVNRAREHGKFLIENKGMLFRYAVRGAGK